MWDMEVLRIIMHHIYKRSSLDYNILMKLYFVLCIFLYLLNLHGIFWVFQTDQ